MNSTGEIEQPVCPDCKSTDIMDIAEDYRDSRGMPPWYCWNCGIRFVSPDYVPQIPSRRGRDNEM